MSSKKLLRSKLFLVSFFLFSVLWGYSISSFLKLSDKNYVGPIVSIASGSLIIDDGKEGQKEIYYTENTVIISSKKALENGIISRLRIGSHVFIEVYSQKDFPLQAKFIRILPIKK